MKVKTVSGYNEGGRTGKCKSFRLIVLLFSLCLLLSGCTGDSITTFIGEEPPQDANIVLAYNKSAGTNPYTSSDATVQQLAHLLFAPLFEVTVGADPQPVIAESIQQSGYRYTVTLKGDATFYDDTPITAQDVVASADAARVSPIYSAQLSGISSVRAQENTVVFNLNQSDVLFVKCLTFPILKQSDTGAAHPTSSGDYSLVDEMLVYRHQTASDSNGVISLFDTSRPQDELATGAISLFDTSHLDEFVPPYGLSKTTYDTTAMLFLGFSSEGELFSNPQERARLLYAISKADLSRHMLEQLLEPSIWPIHPAYNLCEQSVAPVAPTNGANVKLLYCSDVPGRALLVQHITDAAYRLGYDITAVEAKTEQRYFELLELGDYDIFLASLEVSENMDLSPLLQQYGAYYNYTFASRVVTDSYSNFKADGNPQPFCDAFAAEPPFIPIGFSKGTLYHDSNITGLDPQLSNPFYDFNEVVYDKDS